MRCSSQCWLVDRRHDTIVSRRVDWKKNIIKSFLVSVVDKRGATVYPRMTLSRPL